MVVVTSRARLGVHVRARSGEHPWPSPLSIHDRVLPRDRMGQFNPAESQSDVSLMEKADAVEVLLQG